VRHLPNIHYEEQVTLFGSFTYLWKECNTDQFKKQREVPVVNFSSLLTNPLFNFAFSIFTFFLGNVFAYWLYRRGIKKKELWWDTQKNNLINKYARNLPELSINYKSEEVQDVSILRLMLWNSGSEILHRDDITKNHPISLITDNNTALLDAKIIAYNNDTLNFSLEKDNNTVLVDFEYLEPNQGAVLEIVYTGGLDNLSVSGLLKGGNINYKNSQSEFINRFGFRFLLKNVSYTVRRRIAIAFTAFAGLFLFVFFVPLALQAAIGVLPIDSGFLFVVPRIGIFGFLYFVIMINILRTPKIPSGLEIFEQEIT